MGKTESFGAALARVRREQGFASAYAFYHSQDGRKTLGLTFRNYMNLEQDKNLPKPERLETLLLALGLGDYSDAARDLAEAYCRSSGLDRVLSRLRLPSAPAAGGEEARLGDLAARFALAKSKIHLSPKQWRVLAGDFEAYACYMLVGNTAGGLGYPELARLSGLGLAAVKRAVKALAAAGLAKVSGGRVLDPLEDKVTEPPPKVPAMAGVIAGLRRNNQRLVERGKLLRFCRSTIRLTEAKLGRFLQHLDQVRDLSYLYASHENTADSAVYAFRGQVFQVFPAAGSKRQAD